MYVLKAYCSILFTLFYSLNRNLFIKKCESGNYNVRRNIKLYFCLEIQFVAVEFIGTNARPRARTHTHIVHILEKTSFECIIKINLLNKTNGEVYNLKLLQEPTNVISWI